MSVQAGYDYPITENQLTKSQFCYAKNELWRYTYNSEEYATTDTIRLFVTDLNSGVTRKLSVRIPSLQVRVPYHATAQSIAANERYVAICFYSTFMIFKREGDQLTYLRSEPTTEKFTRAKLLGDTLMLSKCYNFKDQEFKASFATYLIDENDYAAFGTPELLGIPFTHFSPHNFITFMGNHFVTVEPTTYNIKVFDIAGELTSDYTKSTGWDTTYANSTLRRIVTNTKNNSSVKPMMDSISKFKKTIGQVKQIYALDDSTLIVNYVEKDNDYFSDVLRYRKGKLVTVYSNISSEPLDQEMTLQKYPVYFRHYDTYFFNSSFIQLREGSHEVSDVGVKPKDYIKKLDRYFKDNDITYKIYIFKPAAL